MLLWPAGKGWLKQASTDRGGMCLKGYNKGALSRVCLRRIGKYSIVSPARYR